MRRLCFLMSGAMVLGAVQAYAQDVAQLLKPGAPVRVWQITERFVNQLGVIDARNGDSLDVRMRFRGDLSTRTHSEVVHLSMRRLDSLEVGFEREGEFGRAVRKGCLIVGGTAALGGSVLSVVNTGDFSPGAMLGFGLIGCVPGMLIGGLVGSGDHTTWVTVPKSRLQAFAVAVAATPTPPTVVAPASIAAVAAHRTFPEDLRLKPGSRVRLWSSTLGASPTEGTIAKKTPDSLTLTVTFRGEGKQSRETVRVAASQIDQLQVEARTAGKSHAQGGALIGLLVGALIGTVIAPDAGSYECRSSILPCGKGIGAMTGGVLGFLLGGFLGWLSGAVDNVAWVDVPMAP